MDENALLSAIADQNDASLYGASSYGASASGSGGGWLDQLGAAATGYLSRRIDVDIARRMSSAGTVGLGGNQRAIRSSPQTGLALTNGAGGLNMVVVAPLALLAIAAVVLIARR